MIEFLPLVLPSDLLPSMNGKLTACQLTPVMFAGVGHQSLHTTAARAWNAMAVQCFADTALHLSTVGTYRTYDAQVQVFNQRMSATYNPITCTTTTRTWNGKKFWLKRGFAPVATPGTSNHGYGIAIDVAVYMAVFDATAGRTVMKVAAITSNAKAWQWVQDRAVSFGFSWEGARPGTAGFEPWHLRLVSGDTPTAAVLAVEAKLAGGA